MKKLNSVLVVLDKPKHEQVALEHAREVQLATQCHLHLVSFCWNSMIDDESVFDVHQRSALKKEVLRARESWLREKMLDAGLMAADVSLETIWTSDIADWVAGRSMEVDYQLVIKSVHHSETLMHKPLDWRLLRECGVPFLMVAARAQRKPSGNILAAIDLRHMDKKHILLNKEVLEAAHQFAQMHSAKLHCVCVVEFSKILRDLDIVDPNSVREKAREKTKDALETLIEPYAIPESRIHMPLGKVGHAVGNIAYKIDADLLVVGSSAHRKPTDMVLGNSAERILVRAPCDVLAVHPGQ